MKALILSVFAFAFAMSSITFAGETPKGFEDAKLLGRVMNGEIVFTPIKDTAIEFRGYVRSFFNKVSTDAYIDLATNHARYPELFNEIKDVKSIGSNAAKTEFDYRATLMVSVGPFTQPVYPQLHQIIARATETLGEAHLAQTITNYADMIAKSLHKTRLIPYEGGILVEDEVSFTLAKSVLGAGTVKNKLKEFFNRYSKVFRKALSGDY